MKIGDKVRYCIPEHGCPPAEAWVIGVPSFSDGEHVTIATEQTYGMPLNVCHCEKVAGDDPAAAARWRDRYTSMYPRALKP